MATEHVMLSYSWSDKPELVRKIKTELDRRGFRTWMDVEQMSGNVNRAMATGIEGAMAVLMCVGSNYKKSRNCEKEAGYADQTQKPILTVIVEEGLKLDGWAGVINGSRLYFDFSSPTNFKSRMDELEKELKRLCPKQTKRRGSVPVAAAPKGPLRRRLSDKERRDELQKNLRDFEPQW
ncbi:uncharacterized protein LOC100374327 [Saccoglossus kowalevskii]|uniref:Uncharacterized protein LOC100374327 n=1 Tax=Saccoglossus kowalevskii TaxID=10224 RepID=A0ABM0GTZ1_SACKO|nr:PREDICTED: uncharacterized protein LOC100374327 [Saccoglossus kowalevskii]